MTEQRRNIRIPVKMNLEVSDIFKQDNVKVSNINAPIEVIDICRDGIGFVTKSVLPIGFYFNSRLEFHSSQNAINCVIQIIRQSKSEDGLYHYGCTFTGRNINGQRRRKTLRQNNKEQINEEYSRCGIFL